MLMPLVASLLAPAMLVASTFTSVVGTLSYETDVSSELYQNSSVIGVPHEDGEFQSFSVFSVNDFSGSFTCKGNTSFVEGDGYGFRAFLEDGAPEFDIVSVTSGIDASRNLIVLPYTVRAHDFNIYLSDYAWWDSSIGDYTVLVLFGDFDEGAYYLPAGSWSYDDGDVSLDMSVLSGEVDGADIISAIGGGLNVVPHLGGSLNDGFDAVFMNNGALTVVGIFAFTLMGLGIGVGVVKKVLNWITGRHGM